MLQIKFIDQRRAKSVRHPRCYYCFPVNDDDRNGRHMLDLIRELPLVIAHSGISEEVKISLNGLFVKGSRNV